MPEIEYIKDLYENEGLSLREIARRTKKDFRTVQKYAYMEDWTPKVKLKTTPEVFPMVGDYIEIIDGWLLLDEKEPRKQRHTVKRIYDRLRTEHGYKGSYSSVKRYVAIKKVQMKKFSESFLPIAHPPGFAEVDFGQFKYYAADGTPKEGYALVLSFPHSNAAWMQVYQSQNQECLLTGLKVIFSHIRGVPTRLRCDNMSTAVVQILKGSERIVTEGFYRFKLHYRFTADFCNPASGNEKGNVENKVGYTRRNMLVPVPMITDFDSFNEELLKLCDSDHDRKHYADEKQISELWKDDSDVLLTLPDHEYEVFSYESLHVSKTGFIKLDTNSYGLSPQWGGQVVQAKIYFDKIEVYYDHHLLKTFRRSYEKNTQDCDWREYLPELVKKPAATEHTKFWGQMPKLWQEYLRSTRGGERKSALTLLSEIVCDGNETLCDASSPTAPCGR